MWDDARRRHRFMAAFGKELGERATYLLGIHAVKVTGLIVLRTAWNYFLALPAKIRGNRHGRYPSFALLSPEASCLCVYRLDGQPYWRRATWGQFRYELT